MRIALWLGCAVVAAVLAVNVAYCWHGSLEAMPTEEQQDKVFVVTIALGMVLAVIEAVLVAAAMRVGTRRVTPRSPAPPDATRR